MTLVEWCERQCDPYEITNSISNMAYLVAHVYTSPHVKSRWLISAVGLGSFYFHVSGSYIGELADEFAMSLLAYFYYVDIRGPSTTYEIAFAAVWTLYVALGAYGIFVSFFISQLVVPVYIITVYMPKTPQQKTNLLISATWLSTAVGCWGYERYLHANDSCPIYMTDPRYYLHSYWHICTALAHYHLMLVIHHPRGQLRNTGSVQLQ
jgi:hypothetical protein